VTVAVVDIGTNTILLLVARLRPDGTLVPIRHEQRIPRLGQGVDSLGALHADSIQRALEVLREYRSLIEPWGVERTVLCGTSAVRDASNRAEFIDRVKEATGFTVEVLSGEEEALWTYRGAVSGVPGITRGTVIDIGGGSTEISVGDRTVLRAKVSLNIGSVRLTERFLRHDPPLPREIAEAREAVTRELAATRDFPFGGSIAIAVAGTATTLSLLAQGLKAFDIRAVTNSPLSYDTVEHLFRTLRQMPSAMIREMSEVMEGRADIITAGAMILREVMRHSGFDEVVVSERGVRYGLALRELQRSRSPGVVSEKPAPG